MAGDLADALSRMENLLAEAGAAIVRVLRRGLDEPEVLGFLDEVGLVPSAEVVAWFGWHDGAGRRGMPSQVIELVPGAEFYELAYLCSECRETRSSAEAVAAMPGGVLTPDDLWRSSWFPLLRLAGKGFLAVDLAGSGGAVSPVHVVWHDDEPERRAQVGWPSIGTFVDTVISRFEDGTDSVDGDGIVHGPSIDVPE